MRKSTHSKKNFQKLRRIYTNGPEGAIEHTSRPSSKVTQEENHIDEPEGKLQASLNKEVKKKE